jgi:hypothetical protein
MPDVLNVMQVGGDQSLGKLSSTTTQEVNGISVTGVQIPSTLPGSLITVGGFFTSQVSTGVVDNKDGTFQITLTNGLDAVYPPGMPVYAMLNPPKVISYSIKDTTGTGTPALFRNDVLFSAGIEDLQVAYLLETPHPVSGSWSVNDPRQGAGVIPKYPYLAVRVSLIAREKDPNTAWKKGRRSALENRLAGAEEDQFRRAILTRVVELRNDGCNRDDTVC